MAKARVPGFEVSVCGVVLLLLVVWCDVLRLLWERFRARMGRHGGELGPQAY